MSNPFAIKSASPRVRLAARLYATGVAPTKKAASRMAGLHPNYLTLLTPNNSAKGSDTVKRLMSDFDQRIEDESVATSTLILELGRKALGKLHQLMNSDSEHVALKAAVDLADRSPATAKTQKVQVDSLTLSGQDVQELAQALVQSAAERERYKHIAVEGLVEVADQKEIGPSS